MDYRIVTIPHEQQRYDTVGDWQIRKYQYYSSDILINVSQMNNNDYEFLVGIHELIEAYLCHKRGIKEEDVTAFDIAFEANRPEDNYDEPGDHIDAPYYKEHFFATQIEHLIADELGVDWEAYDKTVREL